jgi:hypothetical protein
MWELYTRKRAYAGLPHGDIIDRVYKSGLRPRFPTGTPEAFSALAEACWQTEPEARPPFAQICARLDAMGSEAGSSAM